MILPPGWGLYVLRAPRGAAVPAGAGPHRGFSGGPRGLGSISTFAQRKSKGVSDKSGVNAAGRPQETLLEKVAAQVRCATCTFSRHGPVDELHSIENK